MYSSVQSDLTYPTLEFFFCTHTFSHPYCLIIGILNRKLRPRIVLYYVAAPANPQSFSTLLQKLLCTSLQSHLFGRGILPG